MATEKQVRTNIDVDLHETLQRTTRRLDMTQKAYLAQAIEEKLGRFDADMERKRLRKERDNSHAAREAIEVKLTASREDLRQVASCLGVPDTAKHCKQRVSEIEAAHDKAFEERDNAQVQRDHFKIKFEEKCEEVDRLEVAIGNSEDRAKTVNLTQNIIAALLGLAAMFAAHYFGILG